MINKVNNLYTYPVGEFIVCHFKGRIAAVVLLDFDVFVEENLFSHFLLLPSVNRFIEIFTVFCLQNKRFDLKLSIKQIIKQIFCSYRLNYLVFFPFSGSLRLAFDAGYYDHKDHGYKKNLHFLRLAILSVLSFKKRNIIKYYFTENDKKTYPGLPFQYEATE